MPYTLAKWALWLIAAAGIGSAVGWLLRGLRRPETVEPRAEKSTELVELRNRVAQLEQVEDAHDRLQVELDECRARTAVAGQAAVVPVSQSTPTTPSPALVADRDRLAMLFAEQQETIGDLRARLWNSETRIGELQGLLTAQSAATAPPAPDLEAGAEVLGGKVRLNDLTVVEGVGPKIADLLHASGHITTWWELHQTDVETLRSLLADAGPRFQVHDPSSWPQQAGLLARGQWQEFKTFTDRLRAGKFGG